MYIYIYYITFLRLCVIHLWTSSCRKHTQTNPFVRSRLKLPKRGILWDYMDPEGYIRAAVKMTCSQRKSKEWGSSLPVFVTLLEFHHTPQPRMDHRPLLILTAPRKLTTPGAFRRHAEKSLSREMLAAWTGPFEWDGGQTNPFWQTWRVGQSQEKPQSSNDYPLPWDLFGEKRSPFCKQLDHRSNPLKVSGCFRNGRRHCSKANFAHP